MKLISAEGGRPTACSNAESACRLACRLLRGHHRDQTSCLGYVDPARGVFVVWIVALTYLSNQGVD